MIPSRLDRQSHTECKLFVIEAPGEPSTPRELLAPSLFLAGGITNCPDWQRGFIAALRSEWARRGSITDLVVYNPRRAHFPIDDPNAALAQITWEYRKLRDARIRLFWFARGSLNPIVLYEYGKHGFLGDRTIVGVDPEYPRRQDVEIQTALAAPERKIFDSLTAMKIHLMNMVTCEFEDPVSDQGKEEKCSQNAE